MNLNRIRIESAQAYAHYAHDSIGQVRKYSGEPYWVHTDEVASIVASVPNATTEMVQAGHLHDVLEDVYPKDNRFSFEAIQFFFGQLVAQYVFDLTDQYTKENYPQWNRAVRKTKEAERLGAILPESQTVKVADLISNSKDILAQDKGFARTYTKEKQILMCKLTKAEHGLWMRASKQCVEAGQKLEIDFASKLC